MKIGVLENSFFADLLTPVKEVNPEIEFVNLPGSDFSFLKNIKSVPNIILSNDILVGRLGKELLSSGDDIRRTGFFEWIEVTHGKFEPRGALAKTLRTAIINAAPDLDTSESAYVIGDNGLGVGVISSLVRMGYANIYWLVRDLNKTVEQNIQQIKKHFFDVKIQALLSSDLIERQNDGSILVNAFFAEAPEEIIADAVYMNFISKKGIVVDFHPAGESLLIKEAQEIGIRHIGLPNFFLMLLENWRSESEAFSALKLPSLESLEQHLKSPPNFQPKS